jgi:hypothetical protein
MTDHRRYKMPEDNFCDHCHAVFGWPIEHFVTGKLRLNWVSVDHPVDDVTVSSTKIRKNFCSPLCMTNYANYTRRML